MKKLVSQELGDEIDKSLVQSVTRWLQHVIYPLNIKLIEKLIVWTGLQMNIYFHILIIPRIYSSRLMFTEDYSLEKYTL